MPGAAELSAILGVTKNNLGFPKQGEEFVFIPVRPKETRSKVGAHMAKPLLIGVTVGLLMFAMGCGSSSSSPFPITGSYSNSSLNGQYAFFLSGNQFVIGNSTSQGFYREAGVFTADGNGNITAGTDDFNSAGSIGPVASSAITGKYTIGKDGNGVVQINFSGGGSETWAITLVSSSKFYLTEGDAFSNFAANAAGEADQQDTSAINTAPNGNFAFRVHQTLTTSPDNAIAGEFTANSSIGEADVIQSQTLSGSYPITTSFGTPSSGRGTVAMTVFGPTTVTSNFNYYIVNASTFFLMETDATVLGLGRAEKQTGGPFSGASLSGNYTFGSTGDTLNNVGGVNTAGTLSVSGGTISNGAYDSVADGNPTLNQAFTGTITSVDASGRVQVSFSPTGPGNPISEVWYLVSPTRGFSLVFYPNNPGTTEDGTIDAQVSNPFSNGSLKGQYAFYMQGWNNIGSSLLTRNGTFIPDGNGNLNINETTNLYGGANSGAVVTSPIYLTGNTYSASANGRVTANVSNLSSNLVLYMISPNKAYILQGDSGVEEWGTVELQQ
jgi:hypothetical protein